VENTENIIKNLGKISENIRKLLENAGPEYSGKNGAKRCLILKIWRPTCVESYRDLFLEVIPKEGVHDLCGRKFSHKDLPEIFSVFRKFFGQGLGKFGQKSFALPNICLLLHL